MNRANIRSKVSHPSLSPAATSFLDSCSFILTSITFLSLSFLAALVSPLLPSPSMSASLSSTPSSFLPSKRGQLRETLAGFLSSPWVLYVLFFSPLGLLGAHHAWLGHWKRFLAYLITLGLWGGGWLYDLLHFADLAKEQHEQQHKPVSHISSPCSVCADWALQVEGKTGRLKAKPDSSVAAPRLRSIVPSGPTAGSSVVSKWSSPVPPVAATHSAHHTALADAFPLPPPPAPSHTHHKRKSDADEEDRQPSVRVRSAEIDDHERTRLAERMGAEGAMRQIREAADRGRERQGMQREEDLKRGVQHRESAHGADHERVTAQHDEQGSRHQQLKQALLEQHTSEAGSGGIHTNKPAEGVVYLQTIAPSKDSTTAAEVTTASRVTFTNSVPLGATPLKPVEPVAVLRPSADGSGGGINKATHVLSTAPLSHAVARVQAPTPPAVPEADDGASADGGAADAADEQQRDGSSYANGGKSGQSGNGGSRKRGGRGKR